MKTSKTRKSGMIRTGGVLVVMVFAVMAGGPPAWANLVPIDIWTGNVGMSIDGIGSNSTPVGNIQAQIPVGATITKGYLYAAGTPFPWYANSPTTVADYNGAGITLAGNAITNFDTIVGAVSGRADIGQWYTGRADVTALIQSLTAGAVTDSFSWEYQEGSALNNRIDGAVLAIVYEEASLPTGSVVFLDGGQNTDGETTNVSFASPLGDTTSPDFFTDMSLAISFSTGFSQVSQIDINGTRISSAAGGLDDGLVTADGSLITVGGIGDSNANPADPFSSSSPDDELYDLSPFLSMGDTGFQIFTNNPSDDDNIFFMGLHTAGEVSTVNPVPEPGTVVLMGLGLAGVAVGQRWRRRKSL